MAEQVWVQDPLPMQVTTVGGRVDLLSGDVLAQLPVPAWGRVETVPLPPPERLAELLAEVGRG